MERFPALTLVMLFLAATAQAALRSPQVPVAGTSLQTLLNAQGQTIHVQTDQIDGPQFAGMSVGTPGSLTFGVQPAAPTAVSLAVYNVGDASPALFQVLPGNTPAGWFATVGYESSPFRAVVSLFDNNSTPAGTTTYPGADPFAQGFAAADANGTFYSQDTRNAGSHPRMLLFQGTGAHAGDAWLAVETGGNDDYSDAVYLLQFFAPVPAKPTTWGRVKALFR